MSAEKCERAWDARSDLAGGGHYSVWAPIPPCGVVARINTHVRPRKKIKRHHKSIRNRSICDLFEDPQRFRNFSVEANDILIDFSKTNIDLSTKSLLLKLIDFSDFSIWRNKMFSGEVINKSENRSVLHWLLRADWENTKFKNKEIVKSIKNTCKNILQKKNTCKSPSERLFPHPQVVM